MDSESIVRKSFPLSHPAVKQYDAVTLYGRPQEKSVGKNLTEAGRAGERKGGKGEALRL